MLTADQINTIHRFHIIEKWSLRKIAAHLHIGRRTLARYIATPVPTPVRRNRSSKLDPFKSAIAELLEQDPSAHAPVITQRLRTLGYQGGETIVKNYLRTLRRETRTRRAYVRVEPSAGERFDVDWGHFGALAYNGTTRKLYALCLVEAHSRKMYLEFTHSQSFETFVRCHIHAFEELGGCARELWFDNLATAVAEHEGNLVRFNPRFLAFAREYDFVPPCLPCSSGLGKRKSGTCHRLCTAELLAAAFVHRSQRREHAGAPLAGRDCQSAQTSRDAPNDRFQAEFLRPIPLLAPDYRDTTEALVNKDLRLSFASAVTSNPANGGHPKTGQRKGLRTRLL